MKRSKRQKMKQEKPEAVASNHRGKEHDLAYYIHDRVELMHQVFSILKPKELKAMAPVCVRQVSIDDLQELCTDELLGISSKRLCAILDGAEPPTDTESSSSSPEQMETISLDSISSDEEILSQSSSRKGRKHKHRRHSKRKEKDKSKENNKKSKEGTAKSPPTATKESRAGLTVLELLELQARARAIRAQLNKEKTLNQVGVPSKVPQSSDSSSSESAIEIKEEPALVVEISSEDEKPAPEQLRRYLENMPASTSNCTVTRPEHQNAQQNEINSSATKRANDLIITVPQAKTNRKIKLNRNRTTETNNEKDKIDSNVTQKASDNEQIKAIDNTQNANARKTSNSINKKDKRKKDKKKSKKQNDVSEKDGSDHDEITLELSDTEKMDLLEDRHGAQREATSSSSEDSESSSEDSEASNNDNLKREILDGPVKSVAETAHLPENEKVPIEPVCNESSIVEIPEVSKEFLNNNSATENLDPSKDVEEMTEKNYDLVKTTNDERNFDKDDLKAPDPEMKSSDIKESYNDKGDFERKPKVTPKEEIERSIVEEIGSNIESQLSISASQDETSNVSQTNDVEPMDVDEVVQDKSIEISNIKDLSIVEIKSVNKPAKSISVNSKSSSKISQKVVEVGNSLKETLHIVVSGDKRSVNQIDRKNKGDNTARSEGEISDAGSSDIEAVDLQHEVVCISDDDKKDKSSKKKRKKDKKAKKEKKAKNSKEGFREDNDHNFFSDTKVVEVVNNGDSNISEVKSKSNLSITEQSSPIIIDEDEGVNEILELSDDSSCYEVEGVSILSKEPTAAEIEALSSKIDEIDREDVVTDKQITENVNKIAGDNNENNIEDIENISWRDRYLSSKKVKTVLRTSSIFNAMRKKNKELKKKIEMSKKEAEEQAAIENQKPIENPTPLEEGSIEHFKTLTGSSTFVNPVQESKDKSDNPIEEQDVNKDVTNEMKKDAKQLLKMYKRLLKYNNVDKQKDPNKKKKKKSKKNKDKSKEGTANSITT